MAFSVLSTIAENDSKFSFAENVLLGTFFLKNYGR